MTKARDTANLVATGVPNSLITLDAAEIPNISTDKLTSGTLPDARIADLSATKLTGSIADARVPASAVTQHVTPTDLQPIKSDIAALALREATNEASAAFNLPNQFIDTFATDVLGTKTTVGVSGGKVSSIYDATDSNFVYALDLSSSSTTPALHASSTVSISENNTWGNSTESGSLDTRVLTATGGTSAYWKFDDAAVWNLDGDWCIDMQVMLNDNGQGDRFPFTKVASGPTYQYYFRPSGEAYVNGRFSISNFSPALSTGTWYYICWDCHGGNINLYLDGVRKSQTSTSSDTNVDTSANMYSSGDFGDGAGSDQFFNGKIGGLRYSKGASRYGSAATITVPTSPLSNTIQTVSATGTAIQAANAVGSAKTKVGGTMLYKDNAGTATLGTDLKIYFTCDGGSNWTEASSYTAITPVYSTGIKQVRLGETTCTSGTDVRYKAVWANQASGSKETELHGIGINY